MRRDIFLSLVLILAFVVFAAPASPGDARGKLPRLAEKKAAVASIESHREELVGLANRVWELAETALAESQSAALLADYAQHQGFEVQRGVAELPTAFVASYGSGRPILGILGEYDALPGISQKAQAVEEPLLPGGAGHGCGHNLFGAASLGAAVAVKELIAAGKLAGTIRFYGTPAEEAVGGKIYMARAGLFDDLDAVLAWHPDYGTQADTLGSQAMVDFRVDFHGTAAHAASDPWNGRSAVDGLELFTHALNLMREHIHPTARIHYVIQDGGDVPNVVPSHARLWCWVRDSKRTGAEDLLARARAAAEGAALATGTKSELTVQTGSYEFLVLISGARLIQSNLDWLGPVPFSAGEQELARQIQRASGVEEKGLVAEVEPLVTDPGDPEGGSTDVADVSWVVPTLHLSVATAPADVPWHAWPVVAASGTSIGHTGMVYAAKALAATLIDLFADPAARAAVRGEFEVKRGEHRYQPYIPAGPPPRP